ncbi:MAG: S41 family peptidase [Candidatus Hydrothermales bacterium]
MKKFIIILLMISLPFLILKGKDEKEERKPSLTLKLRNFSKVLTLIQEKYFDDKYQYEENLAPVLEKSIDYLLHQLDPYSELMTPEEWEELNIHSTGKFGGIGIQIGIKDGILTVISPLEGTPAYRAGVQAGDQIIEVDGRSTKGWSLQKAVKNLRGEPGSKVKIKIKRPFVDEPFDLELVREIIKIKAVPYYSIVEQGIGYIRVNEFSNTTKEEVSNAIENLKKEGMKKLIVDLRGNPGGLLDAAVEVADIFLPKGSEIVSTRGREKILEHSFKAFKNDSFTEEIPLILIVDRGAASASEIISGALQDWDRALIIGDTTFGKGSVQRLFPLDGGYKVKLTTSLYYLPSGRSIHRLETKDDTTSEINKEKDLKIFGSLYNTLKLKRKMVEGFGVIPDIVLKSPKVSPEVTKLISRRIFFDYALKLKSNGIKETDKSEVDKFISFIKENYKDINFRELEKEKDVLFNYISINLGEVWDGEKGRYEKFLKNDEWVKEALKILRKVNKKEDLFKYVEK